MSFYNFYKTFPVMITEQLLLKKIQKVIFFLPL